LCIFLCCAKQRILPGELETPLWGVWFGFDLKSHLEFHFVRKLQGKKSPGRPDKSALRPEFGKVDLSNGFVS
jgi:hypothetical protein